MATKSKLKQKDVHRFLDSVFEQDVHAKRVLSLANATLGVIASGSLAVHAIGQGLAHVQGLMSKHAIKQVDRLLSNQGVDVWSYFAYWVPYLVGSREHIVVALDWTDFDSDGHSTVALNMLSIAIIMGCNPIYIFGVDLDYSSPYVDGSYNFAYEKNGENILKDEAEGSLESFGIINEAAKNIGVEVYNTDIGSVIKKVFKTVIWG